MVGLGGSPLLVPRFVITVAFGRRFLTVMMERNT